MADVQRIVLLALAGGALLVVAFFLFWKLWFLRQPERDIPAEGIVSPASGKIVKIIEFTNGEPQDVPKGLLGTVRTLTSDVSRDGYVVVIRLTPLDVHYQRAPENGEVIAQAYTKGRFANAVIGASELRAIENEKNEILIDTPEGAIKIVQVAGAAARRIDSYVQIGQNVVKGDVIGLINFGSQVLLVIPKRPLKVAEGERVVDGETVIA